jgi:toxin ParE1/3/4
MSYRLTPLARRDLRSIFAYTADRFGDRQADAYRVLLNQALERIGADPQGGGSKPRPELGDDVRSVSLGTFARRRRSARHVVFYRPADEGLVVLRVLHDAMDPTIADGFE